MLRRGIRSGSPMERVLQPGTEVTLHDLGGDQRLLRDLVAAERIIDAEGFGYLYDDEPHPPAAA